MKKIVMVCAMGGLMMSSMTSASTDSEDMCESLGYVAKTMYYEHQRGESADYINQAELNQKIHELAEVVSPEVTEAFRQYFYGMINEAFSQPKESSASMRIKKAKEFKQQKIIQCKTQFIPVWELYFQELDPKIMQQIRE